MPVKPASLYRIFNAFNTDGSPRSCFWSIAGPEYRLSSTTLGIKIGYWAKTPSASFLEVFLRRRDGDYKRKDSVNIDRYTQATYHIAEYVPGFELNLYSIADAERDGVVLSSIYSDSDEKDAFVRDVYNAGYDGIEYAANHGRDFTCYALFEATVDKLKTDSMTAAGFHQDSLGNCPAVLEEIILAFDGIAAINFE